MESIILDGKAVSAKLESELKVRVENIVAKSGITPVLATILVGEDPSSKVYVNMKGNACKRIGLTPRKVLLPETTTTEELKNAIHQLNEDKDVFGILLQHPVPRQINERECFDAIDPAKDVDGVTATGFGMMALGEKVFVSATPGGILYLLKQYNIPLAGKRAIVIGRSAILGKPVAMLLLNENATVTICHSKSENLPELVRESDIVVAAVGKPDFVKADWIREGAVLVDAGYHPGGIGDVEKSAYAKTSAYTPVPGGVGPMTIVTLMRQTVEAAEKALL
ncbi:MAG TPA: tetrahydrofolate dehydrogenase/cyclohydrolase catalytic domain-containing protein [Spirochaetales bacterium]|nr:tetrahydrofolate dehydrogenase/cyclohydrolase catalytic domain-containing protein [Spirochaetales bacterium]